MSDILSQEEIDALLRNDPAPANQIETLSEIEIDALGEIGNISMGAAATALFTLLKKKVNITTPQVTITTMRELAQDYAIPYVAVEILYTEGLQGNNLLIVHESDVKVITDLMMGGTGTNVEGELTDMHISAISEAMNQMMGSSSTSLASLLGLSINISPPRAFLIDFTSENPYDLFSLDEPIVKVNFNMEVEDSLNSYIMQLLPVSFAKSLVQGLLDTTEPEGLITEPIPVQTTEAPPSVPPNTARTAAGSELKEAARPAAPQAQFAPPKQTPVDVRPVSLQEFQISEPAGDKENIDLIMDVPLEISVELGRTKKLIKDILDLNSGSIIELDKTAGEPVDILVNGKMIAKGEVVVIDDSFGVRITDIVSPMNRVMKLR